MRQEEFISLLTEEEFQNIVTVERAPDGQLDLHSHPFEAKALILQGEIHVQVGDDEKLYKVGDVFQLCADVPHKERYGPAGVTYLVGRK
jgi:quercetin dioxygenase-like cupin family protein